MNTAGRYALVILAGLAVFVAANWDLVTAAWKYREQIRTAASVGSSLQTLGVLK
jgi:uncharacterized membrane protein YoaT (DUF817 family)